MKFEEWYLKNREQGNHLNMSDAEKGWFACKEEVIKILERFDKEQCYYYLKNLMRENL